MKIKHIIIFLIALGYGQIKTYGQVSSKGPESDRKKNQNPPSGNSALNTLDLYNSNQDSLIKLKIVRLALNNPEMKIADANIKISETQLSRARNSWLGTISLAGNINEFVIQNSPAAVYYPKYNLGMILPFDIFSKVNSDKNIAKQNIAINSELKKDKAQIIKAQALMAYEDYKEKKEIVFLERSYIEYVFSAYESAQKAFADGDVAVEIMNKAHQEYLMERSKLVTKEKDLNISTIQLEEIVGVPISEALKLP